MSIYAENAGHLDSLDLKDHSWRNRKINLRKTFEAPSYNFLIFTKTIPEKTSSAVIVELELGTQSFQSSGTVCSGNDVS